MILGTLFVVIIYSALKEGIVLVSVLRGLVKKACGALDLIYFNNLSFDSVFD